MNHVSLMGRLTADPETKVITSGENSTTVASYTLAVKRDYKNKGGEYETDFIYCRAIGKSADFASHYLKKGQQIIIEGQIHTYTATEKEKKRTITFVDVSKHFFTGKNENKNDAEDLKDLPF